MLSLQERFASASDGLHAQHRRKSDRVGKKIDAQIAKNEESQLRAFVNMLGDSKDAAADSVKKLAEASKATKVPFVVPNEFENGPEDYGISPKAELTIIIANESKVVANYAVASAKDLKIEAVIGDIEKMLN